MWFRGHRAPWSTTSWGHRLGSLVVLACFYLCCLLSSFRLRPYSSLTWSSGGFSGPTRRPRKRRGPGRPTGEASASGRMIVAPCWRATYAECCFAGRDEADEFDESMGRDGRELKERERAGRKRPKM